MLRDLLLLLLDLALLAIFLLRLRRCVDGTLRLRVSEKKRAAKQDESSACHVSGIGSDSEPARGSRLADRSRRAPATVRLRGNARLPFAGRSSDRPCRHRAADFQTQDFPS